MLLFLLTVFFQTDQTKPALGDKETSELHRLADLWVSKCGRPQAITEDAELRTLLARILELCKAKLRYELPCRQTVRLNLNSLYVFTVRRFVLEPKALDYLSLHHV